MKFRMIPTESVNDRYAKTSPAPNLIRGLFGRGHDVAKGPGSSSGQEKPKQSKPKAVGITASIGLGLVITAGSLALALNSGMIGNAAVAIPDQTYQPLEWGDLKPPPSPEAARTAADLSNRIDQMTDGQIRRARKVIEEDGDTIVADIDGKDVSIEGFLVPIDFDVERTSDFVLVPYYGACIHVPPPAPNQIIFVKFEEGLAMSEFASRLTTRFRVDGRIRSEPARTDIAEVGYQLNASKIEKSGEL